MIRPVNTSDCAALAEIYNHYILNTSITFEASNIKKGKKNQTIKQKGVLKIYNHFSGCQLPEISSNVVSVSDNNQYKDPFDDTL